jgi:hypothetical protein
VRPSAPPGPSAASGNVSAERRPALQIMTSFTAIVFMGLLAMAVAFPIGLKAPSAAILDIQNFVATEPDLCASAVRRVFQGLPWRHVRVGGRTLDGHGLTRDVAPARA